MNRRYIIGAIVAAVVVVGVLVGISLVGGDDDSVSSIENAEQVQAEFQGIPADGGTIGDAGAKVEIVEYGDTSCPICKDASETSIPQVVDEFVRSGQVKMTFRPIAFISRSSERGALGAEAAGMQDAMWPFVTLIYANQGPETEQDWLTDELLEEAATKLGLDVEKWKADYAGDAVASQFFERQNQADADSVTGTPFFVVKGPNGTESFSGAVGLSRFREAIEKVQ
ncbi:MAG TPA: DsbA family protein [Miltoncostaeaceae bacterium]|nr:DsbA family protein [Miltoncostaeaceae bacterium]